MALRTQLVPTATMHTNVQIIVPWNPPPIAQLPNQRAVAHRILDLVLLKNVGDPMQQDRVASVNPLGKRGGKKLTAVLSPAVVATDRLHRGAKSPRTPCSESTRNAK